MYWRFATISTALCLAAFGIGMPTTAYAQQGDRMLVIEDPSERLDLWLAQPDPAQSEQIMGGVLGMIVGAGTVGVGIYHLFEPFFETTEFPITNALLPAYFMTLGGFALVGGIIQAALAGPVCMECDRWRAARGTAEEHDERLRIEGSLRARAELARSLRTANAVMRIPQAAAALAGLIAVAVAPMSDGDRLVLSIGFGTAILVTGLGLIGDFEETAAERTWNGYRAGLAPAPPPRPSASLAPVPLSGGAGLTVFGSF